MILPPRPDQCLTIDAVDDIIGKIIALLSVFCTKAYLACSDTVEFEVVIIIAAVQ